MSVRIDLLYSFQQPYSILFQIYLITAPLLETPDLTNLLASHTMLK